MVSTDIMATNGSLTSSKSQLVVPQALESRHLHGCESENATYAPPKQTDNLPSDDSLKEQQAYEKALEALNSLQSNADTLRSKAENSLQKPLMDTLTYLARCGLDLNELEKLSFIHVTGTKGKGSTCALTESIIRLHGYKTAFFSSPHLISVTERIRINGQPIGKQQFTQAFWMVYNRLNQAKQNEYDMPAYFKFLTILFFHIVVKEQVDVVVLEVGIGGELDCTNVIRNTEIVGITSLGLEHTQLLGDTLEKIAWQKAGIIKNKSQVFTSVSQNECLKVIEQRALAKQAQLHKVPDFEKYSPPTEYIEQHKKLNNITQLNGSLAIELAHAWLKKHNSNMHNGHNYDFSNFQLSTIDCLGLYNCSWPGRCQLVKFFNYNIYLDGAHTVESMAVCSDWYHNVANDSSHAKVLFFNTTGDRDSMKLLNILRANNQFEHALFMPNISTGNNWTRKDIQSVYSISSQLQRARMHASNWSSLCELNGEKNNSQVFGSIADSFKYIRKAYGDLNRVDILITGSLHLIGATVLALEELNKD